MDKKAMYKLSYGLFVLTAREGEKDNGCIINTAIQAASEPNQLSICVNKSNYTHDMIERTGKFTVSVLNQNAQFELFKHFGFQSGRDTNKFESFEKCARGTNGIYYITEGTNAYISVTVNKTEDLGSHTMFIGEITDMEVLSDIPSVTYEYYQNNIKPKPEEVGKTEEGQTIWRCRICGYEYVGEELPDDFICPLCKHPASDFEKVVKKTEVKVMAANKYAGTQTEKNLQEAFAGESQARNKYTYFASVAKKEGYEQMSALFLKTADNEKEHAKMWFKELAGISNTKENLAEKGQKLRVFGNLPYNISTPLMFHLFKYHDVIQDMHFMLQKEVVKRLCAGPNSKAYGRLTIMAQYFCQVMPVLEVPPSAFKPAPKVDSAVVRLIPHKELPHPVKDLYWLNRVCSQAFNQRRKTLRNALSTLFLPENLTALGIDLNARAENLAIADYTRLANWLADNPPENDENNLLESTDL